MFWKKSEEPVESIDYKEKYFELKNKIYDLEFEKAKLEAELTRVKPVVESKHYKPALSKDCGDCKFCIRSSWSHDIIGCCKDNVCCDFTPKEKEK